jgi:hypothetical protein
MAWWLDPERRREFEARILKTGAAKFVAEESVEDGIRIRIFSWTDPNHWKHHHVARAPVVGDGVPERNGDRYLLPLSDVRTYTAPTGMKLTSTCDGRLEFIALAGGSTEVVEVHSHVITARSHRRATKLAEKERVNTESVFADKLERCRLAAGPPY